MAIITDVEAEAGFNVMIRWFAKASQRYPANENEYYFTTFPMLEPGQEFVLTDPRFDLNLVNDEDEELEYTIRDLCYVQTLIPQFVGFTYWQPDYSPITTLDQIASTGDTTITVVDASLLAATDTILVGPRPQDLRTIISIAGNVITLSSALTRTYPIGEPVNQHPVVSLPDFGGSIIPYPDTSAPATLARILDNDGNLRTDTVEVNTPIFFDTGETVRRYYYSASLNDPVNGARGPGDTVDTMVVHNGMTISGGWWAFGDVDNGPANRAVLIDGQGFELTDRSRDHAFDIELSFSDSEVGACGSSVFMTYSADHSNFGGVGAAGVQSILNLDGTTPPAGYYAWVSTIVGNIGQRVVKFWDGSQFLEGIVGPGTFDNCPLMYASSVEATLYDTEQDLLCEMRGTPATLYYSGSGSVTEVVPFVVNGVSTIFTDPFGPSSVSPSALGFQYLNANSQDLLWNGTNLTAITGTCLMSEFCGDPTALNTGSGDVRNDSLCVYPARVCGDVNARNYQPVPGNNIVDNNVCVFDNYTARYDITNNITGVAEGVGYDIVALPQTLPNGQTYSISAMAVLRSGHAWAGTPPAGRSDSNPFSFMDVTIPHTFEGQCIVGGVAGCNTEGALNFDAASNGSETCFFSLGDFAVGNSDQNACIVSATSNATVTLASSSIGVVEYPSQTLANGWYSNGDNWFQYSSGTLLGTGSCPPFMFTTCQLLFNGGSVPSSFTPGPATVTVRVTTNFPSGNFDIAFSGSGFTGSGSFRGETIPAGTTDFDFPITIQAPPLRTEVLFTIASFAADITQPGANCSELLGPFPIN